MSNFEVEISKVLLNFEIFLIEAKKFSSKKILNYN